MTNLSKLKKRGVSSTNPGSNTVTFINTLQIVTMAYFELTISNLELSSIKTGSDTLEWSAAIAWKIMYILVKISLYVMVSVRYYMFSEPMFVAVKNGPVV